MRLVDDRGRVAYGCHDGPLDFNIEAFRPRGFFGRELGPLRRRLARGAFSFVGIQSGDLLVGLAAVRLGYAAHVFGYLYDFGTGERYERAVRALPSRLAFPMDPDEGVIRFEGSGVRLCIEKSHARELLEVDAAFGALRVAGRFRYGFAPRPLRVVNPSCGDPRRFTFTEKCSPLPAESLEVALHGAERAAGASSAMALYDWSGGYFARHTNWLWSAFAGRLPDGTPVGANFAALANESFYPENAFWIGGERTRIPRVIFRYDPEDPASEPWRVFTEDGAVDLAFIPMGERGERTWLPFAKVNFRQFMGEYSGRVGSAELTGVRGLAEVHLSVW